LRESLTHIHDQFRNPLEEFQGDSATLGDLATPLEGCLQQRQRPTETRLSPWLWGIPLALLLLAGAWMIYRTIDRARVDAYVQRLSAEPGIVVAGAELRNGEWQVSGLRDPLSADPAVLLAQSGLDSRHVVGRWESYQALDPAIVLRRLAASLNAPPTISLSVNGNTLEVAGSAPSYWVERARALVAALPAGSPKVDFSALTDVQDPEFIRLRDAIQGHIILFDSNADRPSRGQDAAVDAAADEFRQLMRVTNRLGFSVHAMISGHADAAGNETANLSLSAARAEVVRSMLRARGIAPELLTVRSAGPLEPVQTPHGSSTAAVNRRVTFTVITGE
jgi:OOP family OmpA-OmpF porin